MIKLPCDECKGKCCTFPVFSEKELSLIRITKGIPKEARVQPIQETSCYDASRNGSFAFIVHLDDGTYPYLVDGKCSVYNMRPQTCKDYGTVRNLPCEYVYPEEARARHQERLDRVLGDRK